MSNPDPAPLRAPSMDTPSTLALAATTEEHLAELTRLLESAGLSQQEQQVEIPGRPRLVTQETIGGWSSLPEWLARNPEAHLLLLLPLPVMAIARRLGEGVVPKNALAEWLNSALSQLNLVRPNRRRVSLMFAEPALADCGTLLHTLSQRIQLDLEKIQTEKHSTQLPDTILRLMAENLVLHSAKARNIVAELRATAIPMPLTEPEQVPIIEQAFGTFHRDIGQAKETIRELHEENQSLHDQMQQARQRIEALQDEERAIESHLHRTELQDLQQENELLLQKMHQLQEELERIYLEGAQNKQEQIELQHRLLAAEATIQALYESKSWRITRPLRALLDLFSGGSRTA
jgi:hypothetical protein